MKRFWRGFEKRANESGSLSGGSGFSGAGKGNIGGSLEKDRIDGSLGAYGEGDGTKTDKTLLDRERGPRDFGIGEQGPEFQDSGNPHIRY